MSQYHNIIKKYTQHGSRTSLVIKHCSTHKQVYDIQVKSRNVARLRYISSGLFIDIIGPKSITHNLIIFDSRRNCEGNMSDVVFNIMPADGLVPHQYVGPALEGLTHWGRVTHICVGSDNGLSPGRHQAIIWSNTGILLIRNLGTNFNEILIEIHTFSFKKIHLKMSSGKWRPFCLGLNVLRTQADGQHSCSYLTTTYISDLNNNPRGPQVAQQPVELRLDKICFICSLM